MEEKTYLKWYNKIGGVCPFDSYSKLTRPLSREILAFTANKRYNGEKWCNVGKKGATKCF